MTSVPSFPFNPTVDGLPFTHYVDNSHPYATDYNNPNGNPARPRVSIPPVLAAGSVVEVRGYLYPVGSKSGNIQCDGTESNPVVVRCFTNAVVLGAYGSRLTIKGQYIVWSGLAFNNVAVSIQANNVIFKNNEIQKHESYGNSAALALIGNNILVNRSQVHNNGKYDSPKEIDVHGILVIPGAKGVWITENDIHHNGGDAIQVGQAQSAEPWAQGVFIYGNTLHEDRENAIDIKKSRDVVVMGNVIYGYGETNSSSGEGIVTHDGAERVWIINNFVTYVVRGIVCTNAKAYIVMGNIITDVRHNPNNYYDPSSLYGSHAIITRDSLNIHHINNTIWGCDGGISLPSGNSGDRVVVNNLIDSIVHPIAGSVSQEVENFITAINGDAKLEDPLAYNFHPKSDSPLINRGVQTSVDEVYNQLYGASIAENFDGFERLNIGAY